MDPQNELIEGFLHTEAIAEYLDRLADPAESGDDEKEQNESGKDSGDGDGEDGDDGEHGNDPGKNDGEDGDEAPLSKTDLESHTPNRASDAGSWAQLNVKTQNLTRHVPGGLGKRRIATNMGRNPRRIGRYLTDPQKRIFDRKVKGNGGVVLVDYSGSMSLSEKDVLDIMEAAPGCTVACYTTNAMDKDGKPNCWILGEKGRMTSAIPASRGGNGVDYPALVWAIQQKQRRNAPVVWVTDGGVIPPHQGYKDTLAMQCIKTCIKSEVLIRNDVEDAVELLTDLATGKRVKQWWPHYFRTTWKRVTGSELTVGT